MEIQMCPAIWIFLTRLDYELALVEKEKKCPLCQSDLHWSNIRRKPRGLEFIAEDIRFDLCCSKAGCRARVLPQSLRFIYRKVYVATTILLACIWKTFGQHVSRQTLTRWKQYWKDQLAVNSEFMAISRAKLPVNFEYSVKALVLHYKLNKAEFFRLLGEFLKPLSCSMILRCNNFPAEDGP